LGKIEKGVGCSVVGCRRVAIRSLSVEKVGPSGLQLREARRAYLCEEHYKEFKKRTKKAKMLEKWRQMG